MFSRLFGKDETVTWWYVPWKEDCTIEKGVVRIEKGIIDIDSELGLWLLKWVLQRILLYIYYRNVNDPKDKEILMELQSYFVQLWDDLWCDIPIIKDRMIVWLDGWECKDMIS